MKQTTSESAKDGTPIHFHRELTPMASALDGAFQTVHGPGSLLGRVEVCTTDEPGPLSTDRDDLDRRFLDIVVRLNHDDPDVCAVCGGAVLPVVYGMPSPQLVEEANKGDVILGGCSMPLVPAASRCVICGYEVLE